MALSVSNFALYKHKTITKKVQGFKTIFSRIFKIQQKSKTFEHKILARSVWTFIGYKRTDIKTVDNQGVYVD